MAVNTRFFTPISSRMEETSIFARNSTFPTHIGEDLVGG